MSDTMYIRLHQLILWYEIQLSPGSIDHIEWAKGDRIWWIVPAQLSSKPKFA